MTYEPGRGNTLQALDVGAFVAPNGVWMPYLVLEWLEGETLGELIKGRTNTPQPGMSAKPENLALSMTEPRRGAKNAPSRPRLARFPIAFRENTQSLA